MSLTYASLCDGIGAVQVAWAHLGWRCVWTSEIEPFACAVVDHHFHLANLGDMTKISEEMVRGNGKLDIIVGGTPCQSFSVAGLRKGLDDPRGNLALEFLRIVGLAQPRWVVWENVPGVLSVDGGRAFGSFLGALGQLGYGFAWRSLDAQFFGVPQRRRRVFVVGHLGDWRPAAAVLLEPEGLCGHSSSRRQTRTAVARAVTASTGGASGKEQQLTFVGRDGRPLNPLCFGGGNTSGEIDVATCLTHHHWRQDFDTETFAVVGPLCAHSKEHGHALGGQQAVEAGHIVTHALTASYDASPDGTGRGVPLAVHENQRGELTTSDSAGALKTGGGKPGQGYPAVCYPIDLRNAGRDPEKHDAINRQGVGVGAEGDAAPACTAGPVAGVAYSFQPRIGRSGRGQPSDVVPALAGADAGETSDSRPCVATAAPEYAVRRLTPRECERLQDFPDDYTLIEFRGKPASDGARYPRAASTRPD